MHLFMLFVKISMFIYIPVNFHPFIRREPFYREIVFLLVQIHDANVKPFPFLSLTSFDLSAVVGTGLTFSCEGTIGDGHTAKVTGDISSHADGPRSFV